MAQVATSEHELPPHCRFFTGSNRYCRYGDECHYRHDFKAFLSEKGLHECPNEGCARVCKGKECKECYENRKFERLMDAIHKDRERTALAAAAAPVQEVKRKNQNGSKRRRAKPQEPGAPVAINTCKKCGAPCPGRLCRDCVHASD